MEPFSVYKNTLLKAEALSRRWGGCGFVMDNVYEVTGLLLHKHEPVTTVLRETEED